MRWWTEFVDWLASDDGWRILSSVVFPFLAIVVAGFIAAMIGRSATRRVIAHHDREQRVSTVSALIGAARRASKWNTLPLPEQQHAEHLAHDADVSTRLLPVAGASMAADWAAHEIAEMKKNSVSFTFQAEQSLMDFRDRLVEWQARPSRAKKLFKPDLDLWAYESAQEDKGLVEKQQEWAKQQVAATTGPVATVTPEHKPITWDTGASAVAAPTPAASPTTAPVDAPQREPYAMPASAAPAAAAQASYAHNSAGHDSAEYTAPGEVQDSGEVSIETPNPVSAQTVRQRVLPDTYDDDLR